MWLLSAAVKHSIERAEAQGFTPSAAQQAEFLAMFDMDDDTAGARLLTTAGNMAEIRVSGVITKAPSFMAMLFGGGNTTYTDINAALAAADADPKVERADMVIDSPGGHFDGLFDTLAAIQSFSKPIRAVVHNQAASAAYAIASQTGEIVAVNKAARVGSIGVVGSFHRDDTVIDIASTAAPKKRPDVSTAEGQAMVREELDAMHELFADAIASGRGVTVETINANYGQGATLLAADALSRGMIDSIASNSTPIADTGGENQENTMDLKSLMAQHPAVYEAAVSEGIAQERDRVSAHLIAGQAAGMMDEAVAAVEAGTAMTSTMSTKYMMAAVNRGDQSTRDDDDNAAAAALSAAATATDDNEATQADAVLAAVELKLGLNSQEA